MRVLLPLGGRRPNGGSDAEQQQQHPENNSVNSGCSSSTFKADSAEEDDEEEDFDDFEEEELLTEEEYEEETCDPAATTQKSFNGENVDYLPTDPRPEKSCKRKSPSPLGVHRSSQRTVTAIHQASCLVDQSAAVSAFHGPIPSNPTYLSKEDRLRKRPGLADNHIKPNAKDSSKRLKEEEKPSSMAVGGGRCDSEDEEDYKESPLQNNFWIQPVENEPPAFQNPYTENPAAEVKSQSVATRAESVGDDNVNSHLKNYINALKRQGLELVEQEGDGNCLFRAVSLQVYGSADSHAEVRERCMDFMARNEEHYSNFVAVGSDDEDDAVPKAKVSSNTFQAYIAHKRKDGVHGNHTEIQAISELFNRPIEVYTPESMLNNDQKKPMNIFHEEYKTSDPPIRLSYHDGNHYNAIIDPLVPTAGLGLGLPGLKPGLADQMQVNQAKAESDELADQMELERVLKESQAEIKAKQDDDLQRVLKESSVDFMYKNKAMALSDLDATNFELEQKVLANSLDTYRRNEHGRKQRASPPPAAARRRRASPTSTPPPEAPSFAPCPFASIPPAAASMPAAAAAAAAPPSPVATSSASAVGGNEEYPQSVQELVMNGFELAKVLRAYDLIGDNFDDLLSFLLSNSGS